MHSIFFKGVFVAACELVGACGGWFLGPAVLPKHITQLSHTIKPVSGTEIQTAEEPVEQKRSQGTTPVAKKEEAKSPEKAKDTPKVVDNSNSTSPKTNQIATKKTSAPTKGTSTNTQRGNHTNVRGSSSGSRGGSGFYETYGSSFDLSSSIGMIFYS